MTNVVIVLSYVLVFAAIFIAYQRSEIKALKESRDLARTSRDEAWDRIHKLHAERLRDIERSTERINAMTTTLRTVREASEARLNNTTKEV
ncbi:hypothetical protein [Nonomuraea gerenzanensis]|uniref:Uncharacterized protein n=1 Tax=Nonomuraea gerenzanensis TaxID=93944 RepID=A0A1M4EMP1_9ACTN|nr:hypothetical protein [Nonomuraea gerenzanensis]UBU11618.1 hypothetical protein LCN96_46150 [Nonomuraea gerenzanensis]SBP00112.1 hypothetical protein BN4615_P9628 [Nonomuraea gerenzanensis]